MIGSRWLICILIAGCLDLRKATIPTQPELAAAYPTASSPANEEAIDRDEPVLSQEHSSVMDEIKLGMTEEDVLDLGLVRYMPHFSDFRTLCRSYLSEELPDTLVVIVYRRRHAESFRVESAQLIPFDADPSMAERTVDERLPTSN